MPVEIAGWGSIFPVEVPSLTLMFLREAEMNPIDLKQYGQDPEGRIASDREAFGVLRCHLAYWLAQNRATSPEAVADLKARAWAANDVNSVALLLEEAGRVLPPYRQSDREREALVVLGLGE